MYELFFAVCLVATAALTYKSRSGATNEHDELSKPFKEFRKQYLLVYMLVMGGDWLQGPYVYALYASYGYGKRDIAALFVAGFGSSMIFGTFVGSLADRFGRKQFCCIYCILYMMSCCTKHFSGYWTLMLGRLLGGIATSLLFSVFDAWLVCEHNERGFKGSWLSDTFSIAIFGNSIVAILSGMLAQGVSDGVEKTEYLPGMYYGGYCMPFDMAFCLLAAALMLISSTWNENFGDQSSMENPLSTTVLRKGLDQILGNRNVLLCGMIQSLFEASMYIFVFNWTPILTPSGSDVPPYGLMFATFMLCCMCGSAVFSILIARHQLETILRGVFVVAAVALLLPVLTSSQSLIYMAFLAFEACVGVYFPCMGTMKSKFVPESSRAAIYNLFRVPLNVIVLTVLLSNITLGMAFFSCSLMLGAAAFLQTQLMESAKNVDDTKRHVEEEVLRADELLGDLDC